MELTVVLTNYLRPTNMAIILDALASQTLPHYLFVWDNSPEQSFTDGRADWIVRSSRNARCSARWWLAAHAETPWVLIMDDDLVPADARVLADLLPELARHSPSALGAAGVLLDSSTPYVNCRHVGLEGTQIDVDTRVDVIKGRFFTAPTRRLEELQFLPLDCEDDIAVSGALGGAWWSVGCGIAFVNCPLAVKPGGDDPITHSCGKWLAGDGFVNRGPHHDCMEDGEDLAAGAAVLGSKLVR